MRWIPVTKRFPNTANHVLVTRKWGEDDYEVCEMDYWICKQYNENFIDNVIAWMPLPEPWKGEANEVN